MGSLKQRLDLTLVEKGLFPSREKARASIMAGIIFIGGQRYDKPGSMIDPAAEIIVKEDLCPYVSRGGLKLEKAIREFDITLSDACCMDIGASTGGFTDCMLQNGARRVYCIDVGYGQLDWKLRNDPRVINMEKVNIRYLESDKIADPIDFISIDVSFISLKLVLPVASGFLKNGGRMVCLVKPQFEAGREQVGKNGIIRDKDIHLEVLEKTSSYADTNGLAVNGATFSPMTGAKGNIEFLLFLEKTGEASAVDRTLFRRVVDEAHNTIGGQQ